jgi:hypothetical protein
MSDVHPPQPSPICARRFRSISKTNAVNATRNGGTVKSAGAEQSKALGRVLGRRAGSERDSTLAAGMTLWDVSQAELRSVLGQNRTS